MVKGKPTVTKIASVANLQNYFFLLKGRLKDMGKIKIGDKTGHLEIDQKILLKHTNAVSCVLAFPMRRSKLTSSVKEFLLPTTAGRFKVLSNNYIKSWSVVLETKDKIILFVSDGNPRIKEQMGLSIFELYDLLIKKFKFTSAFICDAGQSSKICIRNQTDFSVYGNKHYMNASNPRKPRKNGVYGRKIPSALIVYK